MSHLSNLPDFTPYLNNLEILTKTAEQLIKDFQFSGISISFSGIPSTAYNELFSQVEPHLSKLMGKEALYSLLYRIDLSEKQVADACRNEPERPVSFVLTDLVIKRELQKVILRSRFSKEI